MPSLRDKILHAVKWNVLLVPVNAASSLAGTVVVAWVLPLETFGLYNIFLALCGSLSFFGEFGLDTGVVRYFQVVRDAHGRSGLRRFLLLTAAVVALLGVLIVAGLNIFGGYLFELLRIEARDRFLLLYASLYVAVRLASVVPRSVLVSCFEQKRANLYDLAESVVKLALILAAAASGTGIRGIIWALIAAGLLKVGLQAGATARLVASVPRREEAAYGAAEFKKFLRFSGSIYLQNVLNYPYSFYAFTLMLSTSLSREAIAVFSLAANVVERINTLLNIPLRGVLMPTFNEVFSRDDQGSKQRVFSYTLNAMLVLYLMVTVGVLAFSPEVVPLLYSAKFTPSVIYINVLAGFYFLGYAFYTASHQSLVVSENVGPYLRLRFLSLLNVPLLIAAPHALGLMGATVYFSASRLVICLGTAYLAVKHNRFSLSFGFIIKEIGLAAFFGAALVAVPLALPGYPLAALGLKAMAAAVALGLIGCLFWQAESAAGGPLGELGAAGLRPLAKYFGLNT